MTAEARREQTGPPEAFGLRSVRIGGFRSVGQVALTPGSVCALVGEANAGKSNILAAIWALLEPSAPPLRPTDLFYGGDGRIGISVVLADGETRALEATPPQPPLIHGPQPPPVLFLPAALRSEMVVASSAAGSGVAVAASELLRASLTEQTAPRSATAPAVALVDGIERCCVAGLSGLVLLIEEPELYLRPQAQRFLYRLLRTFAAAGNQVLYSTHSPAFLNVARLDELAIVELRHDIGTRVTQPQALPADDTFRALSEFDAERSELFLSRAALLVEGRTEKFAFPFVFQALGYDADKEGIAIVECGGKPNLALFARVCNATNVPYLVVHDRDAPPEREPIPSERAVNAAIATAAGPERTIILTPDFEGVTGLLGRSRKPERAWRSFAGMGRAQVPAPLAEAVERILTLARQ